VEARLYIAVIMAPTDPSGQPNPDTPPAENALHAAAGDALSLPVHEAASFLDISPATLRGWEQAFGFPASVSPEQPVPTYLVAELVALQDALPSALSITSAIQSARRRVEHSLVSPENWGPVN
jgi:hypothetical protein